jgi:hypothetical protein
MRQSRAAAIMAAFRGRPRPALQQPAAQPGTSRPAAQPHSEWAERERVERSIFALWERYAAETGDAWEAVELVADQLSLPAQDVGAIVLPRQTARL